MEKAQYIFYCETCKTTAVVTSKWQFCGFCRGPVEEIGWVGEHNG